MLSGKFENLLDYKTKVNNWPYIVSPKVDGIRCVINNEGDAVTRTLKAIPNKFIRERIKYLHRYAPDAIAYLDGEILSGTATQLTEANIIQKTVSDVMSHAGEPEVTFWYFDRFADPKSSYYDRLKHLEDITTPALDRMQEHFKYDPHNKVHFKALPYYIANNLEELDYYEELFVTQGFEGLMFRNPTRPYHFNRSSVAPRSQHLCKLVRWEDAEAIITGTIELEHNDNEAFIDERGYTKRSSAKAGKRPGGTLGKFVATVINGPFRDAVIHIGTGKGLTASLRQQLWDQRESLPGKIVTFKWRPYGALEANRFPIFKSFRSPEDL